MAIDRKEQLVFQINLLRTLLLTKHNDYGTENLDKHGLYGIIVRMDDKLARLNNLQKSEAMVDESIEDTLMDIAGYAIQGIIQVKVKNGNAI